MPSDLPRGVKAVVTGLAPALLTVLLVEVAFGKSLRDTVPYIEDEVAHYLQVSAFAQAGFSGGYFTFNEVPSAAGFTRFGPHGPGFAAIIGSIARHTGVRPYSVALIGLGLVTLAAFIASWRLRLPLVAGSLALATFWPLIVMIPTSMQESLHFAVALLMATLIGTAIERGEWHRSTIAAFAAVLALGAVVRPTWMFALVGVGWIASRRTPIRLVSLLAAILLAAGSYVFFQWLAAPLPQPRVHLVDPSDVATIARLSWDRAFDNAMNIFRHKDTAEALWHAEALLLVAACGWQWYASSRRTSEEERRIAAASAFGTLLLLSTIGAILTFYEFGGWRAVRLLASPMLLVFIIGLTVRAPWTRWLLVAHVVLTPIYLGAFLDLNAGRFAADRTRISYLRRQVAGSLTFRPDADPWSNTVLLHADAVDYALAGLPPGFGLSVAVDWSKLQRPVRSGHLLLRPEDRSAIGDSMRLEEMQRTPAGTLYRNADAHTATRVRR
jgi:hypothetical protein